LTFSLISFGKKSHDEIRYEKFLKNTGKGTKFLNAFNKQRQGLILVRYANSSKANYEATLANIPNQFNVNALS